MEIDSEIFKAYDIRGIYPDQVNPDVFYSIGRAYLDLISPQKEHPEVVIGRDARPSSSELFEALAAGVDRQGGQVIDIGQSTTPMLYFAVSFLEADGGLMVTASHNPPGYNGLKVTREQAIPVAGSDFDRMKAAIEEMELPDKFEKADVTSQEIKRDYLTFLGDGPLDFEGKIAVDCGNGMSGLIIEEVLEKLDVDCEFLYCEPDCTFPNHEANPLKEETLDDLKELMEDKNIELGVAFDGDGDRVSFISENQVVGGDYITALLAERQLSEKKGAVVYDLRSSKIVPEVISDNGGEPIESRVGHTLIKKSMRETQAVLAGELSGHFYFPFEFDRTTYFESSILALMKMLEIVSERGSLKQAVQPLKKYYQSGEINFEVEDKKQVLNRVGQEYSEAEISHLDGLKVEFDEWWFNLRPSNTEPVLRLNLEADSKKLMKEKTKEIRSLVENI